MSDHEIWHVKLPNGDSKSGTLDQLDEAFQAGLIDESTLVRQEGTDRWVTLAQAAGLEETPPPPVPVPLPSTIPPPVAMSVTDLDDLPDPSQLRGSKKGVVIGVIAAAVVFAAAGVFAISHAESGAPAAAAAPPPPVADINAALKGGTGDDTEGKGRVFTEEQKKALADADKARELDAQRRKAALLEKTQRVQDSKPIKQGNPFHKGGNKYDPLNGNL